MTGTSTTPGAARPDRRMSFDAAAGLYHRGRRPYPDAVFELLVSRCGLRPGARVLDIGAGTGLATGPLLAAGAHVVAVEPGANLQTARDLWSTFPNVAGLAPPDRERFLTRLAAIIDDEEGGTVDDPRLTVAHTAVHTTTGAPPEREAT